jgi:hypothetical protein
METALFFTKTSMDWQEWSTAAASLEAFIPQITSGEKARNKASA